MGGETEKEGGREERGGRGRGKVLGRRGREGDGERRW